MIWGIYLAAGQSKRMGTPKLALPLNKTPLGSIALETAIDSVLDGVIVVTQENDPLDWILPRLFTDTYRNKWIHSPCKAALQGQSESIKYGLRQSSKLGADAVLILLADQPFVTDQMINHFISIYQKQELKYVTASYQGIPRPPVLFDSSWFPKLLELQGDEGARRLVRNGHSKQGLTIKYMDPKYFIDIDTPADYQNLIDD